MKTILCSTVLSAFVLCASNSVHGQSSQVLLQKAAQTFSSGKHVSLITLNANAKWTVGSSARQGIATLTASADGSFDIQLKLAHGSRMEAQTSFVSGQHCTWSGNDDVPHPTARHNCMSTVAWFLPSIALFGNQQPSEATATLLNQGSEATTLVGIRLQGNTPAGLSQATAPHFVRPSATDIYFDSATLMPVALSYNIHPDQNSGSNIPVQVLFTDFRRVNGILLPFRIQRYLHGQLNLDLVVTAASAA